MNSLYAVLDARHVETVVASRSTGTCRGLCWARSHHTSFVLDAESDLRGFWFFAGALQFQEYGGLWHKCYCGVHAPPSAGAGCEKRNPPNID
jgi:hypothetical protein